MAILISTSKNGFSFLLLLSSSLQQNWRKGRNGFCLEERRVEGKRQGWGAGGEMAQTMYAHVNK
jgi:hypothetical protein